MITQDIETFDLEDFKYNFVNITAFRLVDADDVGVRSVLRDMERFQPAGNTILNKSRVIQASVISQFFFMPIKLLSTLRGVKSNVSIKSRIMQNPTGRTRGNV